MSRRTNIIVSCAAILFIVVLVWTGVRLAGRPPVPSDASPYAAVYLTNGEIYFGKLTWSSSQPILTDVWVLQQNTNKQGQPQLNIAPFQNALWTPINEIYLNPQSVLYWTYIQNNSQLSKMLQSP
jgi:hypothetical protein